MKHGVVQEDEALNHSKLTLEGFGSQPLIEAERVFPTTAVPVIVGAGDAANGRPAKISSVFFDATVAVWYPALETVARTNMVVLASTDLMV